MNTKLQVTKFDSWSACKFQNAFHFCEDDVDVDEAQPWDEDEEDDDDGNVEDDWKLLLLIPISDPMVFLTSLSSMSPYLSWPTMILFLEESMLFSAEGLFASASFLVCFLRCQKMSDVIKGELAFYKRFCFIDIQLDPIHGMNVKFLRGYEIIMYGMNE